MDRDPLYTSGKHKKPEGLALLWRVAAAIRLYLYCECLDFDGVKIFEWLDTFFPHNQNDQRSQDMLRSYIFQDRSYDTNYNQLQKLIDVSFYGYEHNWNCLHPANHEVFAPIFRYLQHCFPEKLDHQIKATYHVAEDNYDIIDGIRAIDEAVLFCDLRSGSRLGHATLLGMDAEKYYQSKNNQITIPIQNWLDNVVWLYYYIKENNIIFAGSALLLDYLRQEFEKSFHEVYLQALSSDYVKNLLMERNVFEPCFDIEQYFCSWLLRGDEPDLYKTGFADKRFYHRDKYSFCYSSDKIDHARESAEANYLYYLYHFRKFVKEKGGRFIIKSLPEYYISGVIHAQKKMCSYIASMGICIETNPTSNLLISSINSYTEHPISKFYCNGLNSTDNETQLNISVNTDDKGVFSTSLSNEYSYLLFNLEQIKDAEGKQKYSRFQLLKCLDEIRRMGNEQSFAN